jgi:hemoglobin
MGYPGSHQPHISSELTWLFSVSKAPSLLRYPTRRRAAGPVSQRQVKVYLTPITRFEVCDAGNAVGPLVTRAQEVGTVEGSLYDRLGGVEAITAVVRAFDERAGKDDRINQKFARTNLDRLTKEFIDQMCQDTGGPCTYTGLSMKKSHTNMGVTNGEFDAFMEDLAAVLDDFKVGKADQEELLNLLRPMRDDIVEDDSSQTGTPLPPAFTPAPPL